MPVHNGDIAEILESMADLLDIRGDNPFRIRAYRNAARTIRTLSRSVADMAKQGEDLTGIYGIGDDLAGKIATIVSTGELPALEKLEKHVPPSLLSMLNIPGLGPRRVGRIYELLGITDLKSLRLAAEENLIRELPGFGDKTQSMILDALERAESKEERTLLMEADELSGEIIGHIRELDGVRNAAAAGSLRRRRETVGDIDILVSARRGTDVTGHILRYEDVDEVIEKGHKKTSFLLRKTGLRVDVRVVPHAAWGAALVHFTGSRSHNIRLRKLALDKDLSINEYGVFSGKRKVAGKTEEGLYEKVGLPWFPPEIREDRGEFEAAKNSSLPALIQPDDIRGDLHVHTSRTDGHNTIEEMAMAAKKLGYEYIAITDHSRRLTVAGGLKPAELLEQLQEIDRLNDTMSGIRILKGIEVDILEDGSLDMPDDILARLDVVNGSVHHRFGLSKTRQTRRVIKAMENKYFNILGHPTGRKINIREPYEIDMEEVLDAALELGCFMELNSFPIRLDMNDHYCRRARELGVHVSISTDSHRTSHLEYMKYGLGQARRGWLEPGDVLNTRAFEELKKLLDRKGS